MELVKLQQNNIQDLYGKQIYCFEKSISYLEELHTKYREIDIAGVLDDFKRNQGTFLLGEKEIEVCDTGYVNAIDWNTSELVITSDYFYEAFEKIKGFDNKPEVIYYFANHETQIELSYLEKYKNDPLDDMIIFRSGPHASSYVKGMDFGDNARALFECALKEKLNEKYKLVWLVKTPAEFEKYKGIKNVEFLSFDWNMSKDEKNQERYYYALFHAKYIFFTDAYGFARNCRKDQIRIQLWHGCGFKNRVNFSRCEKRYEYTTVVSDLYAKTYAGAFGLRDDQMLVTGYAKEDWIFHPISKEKFATLDIPKANKYIFWLPTFRSTDSKLKELNEYAMESQVGLPMVQTFEQFDCLNELLKEDNMTMIIKLHPFQSRDSVHSKDYSNIYLLENEKLLEFDIQINELLWYADAMISDYSSVAVDYLVLDRPLAFTLDDVEEYRNSRGFFFEDIKSMLPGKELFSWDDFMQYVDEIAHGIDRAEKKRKELTKKMHKYSDDQNSVRIFKSLGIL